MKLNFTLLSILFFSLFANDVVAQNGKTSTLAGQVTDLETGAPIELATIYIKENTNYSTEASLNGNFTLKVPHNKRFTLIISRTGYKEGSIIINPMRTGETRKLNVKLANQTSTLEVIVTASKLEEAGLIKEDVEELKYIPSTTMNLENVLPHIALGVSTGTGGELSSQYNVRGGNYDENLVYVNDFEIYRPQLIRSGQQEGLSFPNMDLIRDLSFSSGGFEARYGDKLSSVLDIKYKRPDSTRASIGLSALGGSAHIEGSMDLDSTFRKFRYLVGARYKTTKYLLGTLDVQGEYVPNFADIQGYFTFDINRDWQVGLIGNYNRSEYQFTPASRETAFGLIDFSLDLFTVFEGQEVDDFTTYMAGTSLTYVPDRKYNPLFLKFLASVYQSNENERIDIIGDYILGQIETGLGSDNFGEIVAVLGTGTQHQFVRNYLTTIVSNFEHKGGFEMEKLHKSWETSSSHFLQWNLKFQNEQIFDDLNEWERLDSAGYSLPFDTTAVQVQNVLKTQNELVTNRLSGSFQDTYTLRKDSIMEMKIMAGIRGAFWNVKNNFTGETNNNFLLTPRAQLLYKPLNWERDMSFRFATGMYFQPAFYREMRRLDGTVNVNLEAQKSLHILGGFTWDFYSGKRDPKLFRFITEIYYKKLWDMVIYDLDNVRIRYSGENDATGYVAGIDLRVNGEFVPGAESWVNISFLRARESITDVQHLSRGIGDTIDTEISTVRRPTDRFMNLNVFFQDYLPKNENFKMHLNLSVGTGLPFGLKENNRVRRNQFEFAAYHRVDIGFAYQLWDKERRTRKPKHPLRFARNAWLSLEVFNLLEIANTASNTWIKTIYNTQYAIPNNLTSRR
ncbi:MAG: TonB-dependent receptor, partial [Saprospiraceae bacterium]|nr:TonB-dependent receptor [Saprospiraceae bacterium]